MHGQIQKREKRRNTAQELCAPTHLACFHDHHRLVALVFEELIEYILRKRGIRISRGQRKQNSNFTLGREFGEGMKSRTSTSNNI